MICSRVILAFAIGSSFLFSGCKGESVKLSGEASKISNEPISAARETVDSPQFYDQQSSVASQRQQFIVDDEDENDDPSMNDAAAEAEMDRIENQFEAEMAELDRKELIDALAVAERKYNRQRQLMAYHKKRYHEKLRVWWINWVLLEMRGTPGLFAGETPEKDVYAFMEVIDASEEVLEILEMLDGYDNSKDEESVKRWAALKNEVTSTVKLDFPSSGSPLEDAVLEMRTASYRENAGKVTPLVIKMSQERAREGTQDLLNLWGGKGASADALQDFMKAFESEGVRLMKDLDKLFK